MRSTTLNPLSRSWSRLWQSLLCNLQQTQNIKYKTSMCRDITQKRGCPRGNNCTFAHSEEELERYWKFVLRASKPQLHINYLRFFWTVDCFSHNCVLSSTPKWLNFFQIEQKYWLHLIFQSAATHQSLSNSQHATRSIWRSLGTCIVLDMSYLEIEHSIDCIQFHEPLQCISLRSNYQAVK